MKSFKLKVLGKDYTVRIDKKLDQADVCGTCLYSAQLLSLAPRLGPQQRAETLLHELIHAVGGEMGLNISERTVRGLAIGLFQVLRDNPKLIRMIKVREADSNGQKNGK